MEALTPTIEQLKAIKQIINEPTRAALNGSTMGTGKTLKAVEVAKGINAQTILLIAPLGTRLGWKVTFERQGVTLPFKWINSTKAGKEAYADWEWQQPGIYFVGVEYFTRLGWDGKERTKVWTRKPDLVLFDEVHRSQNRNSKTFKTLKQVQAGFKLAMSGTPTGNSFEGAWAVTKWLWPDIIPNSFHTWASMWCRFEYDYFSPNGKRINGEANPGAFFNSLPCYIRIESELDVDLDDQQVYCELSTKQRKAYNDLEKNMVTWIQDNPLVVEFPITLRARLRQATLGMFSVDESGEVWFDNECESSKIDTAKQILAEDFEGEPTLIFTDSRKFADVLVYRLNDQGHSASAWHGGVSQDERERIKQEFIDGKLKYLIGVTSALGTGVDGLQLATRNILWMSRSDDRILNEQAMARVYRTGQTRQVRSRELIAVDTYDAGVLSSQVQKGIEMNRTLKAGK